MIIEHRTYTLHPGKMPAYFAAYIGEGLAIQLEYLPKPIGYYMTELGTLNQIIHMWGYDSLDDRARRRAYLKLDERWSAYTAKILPMIQHQESKILLPASFHTPIVAQYAQPSD
ncbi:MULTISPECIES: NIPSNAP family protein [Burkholderia]|uniref:NIPSNAP family protein n=1 Tax=Burkholderia contaminans TaxID=488447 RepID=A0A3N8PTB4_9BURK|nr:MULTISPECIES: NIPSNAP family protein [Burkholderia]RQR70942.1 NIPSNAP family protein [Burkholderia sp. Bp9011]RQR83705.1 NIPSNAP family protein [Burkholderia sp. Bp9010]RQS64406.1 NIPSNAP family protein [Burkholderia sp. Bp8977]RQT14862.1 NIPSNAP family protein [Burkholderia contaminans]